MTKLTAIVCAVVALAAGTAHATYNLQITEIWPGNDPGSNLTEDWFEVTNFGDMAWTDAFGNLYYDDDSADAGTADLISGVSSIAPGESVIFINDSDASEFISVWGAGVSGLQFGTFDGSGLGQGGDAVTLFLSVGAPTGSGDIIDFEEFPDAELNGGQSYDTYLGEFSTVGNLAGAWETSVVNDELQPAIGSPGQIPEPASAMILLAAAFGLLAVRRR